MSRIEANTDVFRAIADPTRRPCSIRLRRRAGQMTGTIAADFRSRPAGTSFQAFARGARARLVVDTRIGQRTAFTPVNRAVQSVAGWSRGYRAFWQVS